MVKNGDFVKVQLTGKLPDGTVFDKSKEPLTVCIGEGMLLPGLDERLSKGDDEFTAELKPEDAFGKKQADLLQVVPTEQLKKQGIKPEVGMQLTIDGQQCTVKRTGGGRTIVDFNHPLAGKDVVYDVKVTSKVDDLEEQVQALMAPLGVPAEMVSVDKDDVTVKVPSVPPKPVMDAISEKVKKLTKTKNVHFEQGKK